MTKDMFHAGSLCFLGEHNLSELWKIKLMTLFFHRLVSIKEKTWLSANWYTLMAGTAALESSGTILSEFHSPKAPMCQNFAKQLYSVFLT